MVTADDHFRQYRSNKRILEKLWSSKDAPYDWIVTVTFYTALHLVERVIVASGNQSHNHDERLDFIKTHNALKEIRAEYMELEKESKASRYHCGSFNKFRANYSIENLKTIEGKLLPTG